MYWPSRRAAPRGSWICFERPRGRWHSARPAARCQAAEWFRSGIVQILNVRVWNRLPRSLSAVAYAGRIAGVCIRASSRPSCSASNSLPFGRTMWRWHSPGPDRSARCGSPCAATTPRWCSRTGNQVGAGIGSQRRNSRGDVTVRIARIGEQAGKLLRVDILPLRVACAARPRSRQRRPSHARPRRADPLPSLHSGVDSPPAAMQHTVLLAVARPRRAVHRDGLRRMSISGRGGARGGVVHRDTVARQIDARDPE